MPSCVPVVRTLAGKPAWHEPWSIVVVAAAAWVEPQQVPAGEDPPRSKGTIEPDPRAGFPLSPAKNRCWHLGQQK